MTLKHTLPSEHSLRFVSGDIAATWPSGCKVLIRIVADGNTQYEADNYHRPDWVADKVRGSIKFGQNIEWAMLEYVN